MRKRDWAYLVLIAFILGLSFLLKYALDWYNDTFGVTIKEILYTITSPMKGADANFVKDAILYVAKRAWIYCVLILILALIEYCLRRKHSQEEKVALRRDPLRIFHIILTSGSLILFIASILYLDQSLCIREYIADRMDQTTIYEERYVSPLSVSITPVKPKNLIWISMESMENTYADRASGGIGDVNYIPHLTELAASNISFSNNDSLGGWRDVSGTSWTMASLFSTTSGLPFSFPIEGNGMIEKEYFASGAVTLGDVLQKFGYTQEYLCGSDNSFAGCNTYFRQHGDYRLFDYVDAVKGHFVPEDYKVGWGLEDAKTYAFAKEHLLELASSGKPFNFMMSTIDTHPNDSGGGYLCELCESKYPSRLANVLDCADRQVYDFVNWCKEQDFYKDTVIVICGDHLRMDKDLVDAPDSYVRTVYNTFINVDASLADNAKIKNREFCSVDMFPTVLSAIGFKIEGNRLGLGTDLFSERPTLIEEMGYSTFQHEISKYSAYYVSEFQ